MYDLAVTKDLKNFADALSGACSEELAILHPLSVRYYLLYILYITLSDRASLFDFITEGFYCVSFT